ncbi:UNVERIFIED_CONTAM: hypothetical protein FKN15_054025 [Acipenser sinensis]
MLVLFHGSLSHDWGGVRPIFSGQLLMSTTDVPFGRKVQDIYKQYVAVLFQDSWKLFI